MKDLSNHPLFQIETSLEGLRLRAGLAGTKSLKAKSQAQNETLRVERDYKTAVTQSLHALIIKNL